MTISFKDFVPNYTVHREEQKSIWDKFFIEEHIEFQSLNDVLDEVNKWIESNEIEIINIETLVLPNMHREDEEGSTDVALTSYGSGNVSSAANTWYQFIRVWFRAQRKENSK